MIDFTEEQYDKYTVNNIVSFCKQLISSLPDKMRTMREAEDKNGFYYTYDNHVLPATIIFRKEYNLRIQVMMFLERKVNQKELPFIHNTILLDIDDCNNNGVVNKEMSFNLKSIGERLYKIDESCGSFDFIPNKNSFTNKQNKEEYEFTKSCMDNSGYRGIFFNNLSLATNTKIITDIYNELKIISTVDLF